ncbi:hypothetical protein [Streptococcus bouchesdurhonensis]|uniref:hypothetical protein n=1 Tax=Streptococcus bouchesdurhonensis TaxID=2954240 RepID=UPI003CE50C2E
MSQQQLKKFQRSCKRQCQKAKVKEAVSKANPTATNVVVKDNGDVTVTLPDGTTKEIPSTETVEKSKVEVTPVADPAHLTEAEKAKVKEAVSKANPTATNVVVKDNGDVTVTLPDGTTKEIPSTETVEKSKVEVTPVADPAHLTEAEKAKVKEAVSKANPTATNVVVKDNGDVTVTLPDGTTKEIPSTETVEKSKVEVTPVADPAHLTEAEKAKVKEAVSKANPTATNVVVKDNGDVTVTLPDGTTKEIPSTETVEKSKVEVTPVADPAHLTEAEKAKVKEAVSKANPTATNVVVKDNGDVTVTLPDGTTKEIPSTETVEKSKVEVTPVADPAHLTEAEKAKVKEAVSKANPTATNVVVKDNGDVTVTLPDGTTKEIPSTETVEKSKVEVTPVADPAHLTEAEKAKVKEAVSKANPTATNVVVKDNGDVTVTLPDGTTKEIPSTETVEKSKVEVTPVADPAHLTEAEKAKVKEAVSKANPTATNVVVKDNGDVTVTLPDGTTKEIPSTETVEKSKVEVTPVADPAHLTEAEKAKVKEAVSKANPTATNVVVKDNGDVTVTLPDGTTKEIPSTETVEKSKVEVTPVADPAHLTEAEKAKVKEAVSKANPTATNVVVKDNGDVTVTLPDGTTKEIPSTETVEKSKVEVTPVADPAHLTEAEKAKVKEAVSKANPTATNVVVKDNGDVTVTLPDGTTKEIPSTETVEKSKVEVTPVADPAHLTEAEKAKVKEAVSKANPTATNVVVKDNGDVTVTLPDGTTKEIPSTETVEKSKVEVTPVADPAHLTEAEKAKVKEAVSKANPTATNVVVKDNGDVTVTLPDGTTKEIPSTETVEKSKVEVTPVADPAHLTEAEKAKVKEAVSKANPTATNVVVKDNGDVTVTLPDGTTKEIPSTETVEKSKVEVTPVADPAHLTEAEKAKVKEAVSKANPTATNVVVKDNGDVTVTLPDGTTKEIPSTETVEKSKVEVTPVADPAHLTEAEKAKVKEAVSKANPTATNVVVKDNGDVTVTLPDGTTKEIPSTETVEKSKVEVTPVADPAHLTEAEKAKVKEAVSKANPTATNVVVKDNGDVTVTLPDGTTKEIPSTETVEKSKVEVTPVADPAHLTEAEKAKVKEAVSKANPTATNVVVKDNGDVTVTLPDGTTKEIPSTETVEKSKVEVTPVADPAHLTEAEKAKVKEAVSKANPTATNVVVKDNGDVTVTLPDGTTKEIPSTETVEKSKVEVTPVADPAHLTEAEKAKVKEAVSKANPTATNVVVKDNGDVTVTLPDGTTKEIPSTETVEKSKVEVTPVADPAHLTEAEKAKVKEAVSKANPTATNVVVKDNGDVTVTLPDGTTKEIPSTETVEKSKVEVTPVADPAHLTEAEKAKVKEAVSKANPTATNVVVKDNGDVTVTLPDGTTKEIPSTETVEKSKVNARSAFNRSRKSQS